MRRCGRTRLQREKERGEGSKEVSDLLTVYAYPGVAATSQEFPKWQSAQTPPTLSLTQSSLFRPLVQPPILLATTALHPPLSTTFTLPPLLLHVGGVARCLPLSRGRRLYFRLTVKVNGATSRGELPCRLTGTPNHNFNAYTV